MWRWYIDIKTCRLCGESYGMPGTGQGHADVYGDSPEDAGDTRRGSAKTMVKMELLTLSLDRVLRASYYVALTGNKTDYKWE